MAIAQITYRRARLAVPKWTYTDSDGCLALVDEDGVVLVQAPAEYALELATYGHKLNELPSNAVSSQRRSEVIR